MLVVDGCKKIVYPTLELKEEDVRMKRNQKKLILLSVLGLLIGLFLYANRLTGGQMHAHAEKLERDAYLAEYQKIEEATAFFKNDGLDASFNVEGNGDTWKKAKQVSEALYQDSDGHFEQSWGLYLGLVADQKDVDPFLVYELLKVESGATFDEHAIGPETKYGHAYGMAQFMTNTAPWIADMAELEYKKDYLFNPYYAIHLSVQYLQFLHDQYNDWDKALTAYHRGMGGLQSYLAENGHAKSDYAVTIQKQAKNHDSL